MKINGLTRHRAFSVNYLPATNVKGSRLKLTDEKNGVSRIFSLNHECRDIEEQAQIFLNSEGIKIVADTWIERKGKRATCFLLTEDFSTSIKG